MPRVCRDYGVLVTVRHPLAVTVTLAMLGAASRLMWDTFTHPYVLIGHPFTGDSTYLPALHTTALAGLPWWRVIHLASELAGTAALLGMALHIGRKRLLLARHGPAPAVPRRPALFWSAAATGAALLTVLALALPGNALGPNVIGVRLTVAVALAMLGAAGIVAVRGGKHRHPNQGLVSPRGGSRRIARWRANRREPFSNGLEGSDGLAGDAADGDRAYPAAVPVVGHHLTMDIDEGDQTGW